MGGSDYKVSQDSCHCSISKTPSEELPLSSRKHNMLLKPDLICLNYLGWQKDDSSIGMTVALFLGHNHKPSFHLQL
jgi:hypothetical protein